LDNLGDQTPFFYSKVQHRIVGKSSNSIVAGSHFKEKFELEIVFDHFRLEDSF
jgi:hypothetical protein